MMDMDIEQVREEINAAFANLPVPAPRTLTRDRKGAAKIRKEFANKNWQSIPPEFFVKGWSSFYYLSPEAYRYYLPALLLAGLQDTLEDSGLTHSVLWVLRPSFGALYYDGEDRDLRVKQSAFTPAQYRAVCAFLGLMFDRNPHWRHLAAQDLHWGWNDFPTPALEAVNNYYRELRSFTYPEPQEPEIAELCREIRTAFAMTPYPGDDQLSGSDQGDEPAENAMELRGVRWQSVHPTLLARCYTALSFLSTDGFRYFLPAFLLADLMVDELDYDGNADPVFDLTHDLYDRNMDQFDIGTFSALGDTFFNDMKEKLGISRQKLIKTFKQINERQQTHDMHEYRLNRLMPFTHEERITIIHYLEFQARDEYRAIKIQQALERYWRPSLQSSVT